MAKFKEKTLKSRRIYKGRIVSLREDTVKMSNGRVAKREIVEHAGAVVIIGITDDLPSPRLRQASKKILLIKQFRKPIEKEIIEIPAGLVHADETSLKAAKRELLEETGYHAKKIKKVLEAYTTPGYSTEMLQYFLAWDLETRAQKPDEDELIKVMPVPLKAAWKLVEQGKIKDNKTIIAIVLALKYN